MRNHPASRVLSVAAAAASALMVTPPVLAKLARDDAAAKTMLVDAICGAEFEIRDEVALSADGVSLTTCADGTWRWDRAALERCTSDELTSVYAHVKGTK